MQKEVESPAHHLAGRTVPDISKPRAFSIFPADLALLASWGSSIDTQCSSCKGKWEGIGIKSTEYRGPQEEAALQPTLLLSEWD